MTQNSFLRLISSERIFREDAVSNREAIAIYSRFRSDPRIGWIDEPGELESVWLKAATYPSPSPKRWMDAYMFACALLSSAVIVTFDRGFRQYQSQGLKVEFLA
jgi:predicted nucleic acid-binding protein